MPFCSLAYERYWDRQSIIETTEYNCDLGINVPVQTQKWCDHYQNMRIMIAVLRFKKWGKLCSFSQIMLKIMLAQSIKGCSYILLGLDYYVCNADYEMLYSMSPSYLKFSPRRS